jgi:hypothetical protein
MKTCRLAKIGNLSKFLLKYVSGCILSCPPPPQVSQEDVKKILANFDNSEALALNGVSVAGTK